jgi:hypothetical protein
LLSWERLAGAVRDRLSMPLPLRIVLSVRRVILLALLFPNAVLAYRQVTALAREVALRGILTPSSLPLLPSVKSSYTLPSGGALFLP